MKTVMLLESDEPVRVSDETAHFIVEKLGSGYYVPKKVWKDWKKKGEKNEQP